ncbi:GlxA family transcriptional regulator [uncultured Ruegeria sp.]|uniref:GlxA family transcriptional regulator n=1 Tax=uncultured Ruegeria sp. TaxID=259304 RepID=UPI00260520E6|nr:helix-turn-helix domain-containing protein [uncultured Ruegeria sp.]
MHESFEFLLLDGFSNMVLASALEPLRDVKMRSIFADLDWEVTTLDGATVTSSSKLGLSPNRRFDPEQTKSTLVIVAGYSVREQVTRELVSMVRLASRNARRVLALDTASWLLAEAGVLDGHRATIHWQELDAFTEAFPNVDTSNARYVSSGPFMTCGGASTVLEMILELIEEIFGPAAAFDASSMFIFDPARQKSGNRGAARLRDRGSPKLLQALNIIAENVETPLTTFELAERVSLSERTLCRAFSDELGMTPGKYYKLYRLQHARYLVQETRSSTEQIAHRCGFSCASALRRSFTRVFGKPINAFRL